MSLDHISLVIEPRFGSMIDAVCRDVATLAVRLDMSVQFTFNGVFMVARPGESPDALANEYRQRRG